MSIDRSLKGKDSLARHRNVLTRAERVETLEELGRWTDESTVIGMPKVAHRKVSVGKKDKTAKTDSSSKGTTATSPTKASIKRRKRRERRRSASVIVLTLSSEGGWTRI